MTKVRNTKEYWTKVGTDLQAFDEHFGAASWFFTVSSAEYEWEPLRKFLLDRNNDLPDIKNKTLSQLCQLDPISVEIFWDKKFRIFFKEIIRNQHGPLGIIHEHFWRVEYQARGMQHRHGKLWAPNAPRRGDNTDEEILDYIVKHVTCSIPDPDTQPELYQLVMKYQVHKCTKSCLKFIKSKNRKVTICRYGFPKPLQAYASLNSVEKTLMSRSNGNIPIKMYNLGINTKTIYFGKLFIR